ncbi:CoA-transferase family III domain-containing protein [Apiospora rasikravindrae]|uniref:CoA-transferase family III domain-containing protein n=1 Tax=Apiospora rasikravindrae TaxID=990691 RepID=A0ABR1TZV9_9PEZI
MATSGVTAGRYSVPNEAESLFRKGVMGNPLIEKNLPDGAIEASKTIRFEGSEKPSLPINWRFAESIAAIKAYEATVINVLLQRKYGMEKPAEVVINTDHAQLFIMSTLLWTLDPDGDNLTPFKLMAEYFPDWDKHQMNAPYRGSVTNIYKTKDDRYFHLHGSMNPGIMLEALGLPQNQEITKMEEAWPILQGVIAKYTAAEIETLSLAHRQAGTICWTTEEYKFSEHGKANADIGLFELEHHPNPNQPPGWWPDPPPPPRRSLPSSPSPSTHRPLAGLKVVDLTRVIAGPAVSRGLAELGASVMRITAPHLTDMSVLHPDLNHGKWNASLDLRTAAGREALRDLVADADVFLQGYRPGVLDKFGFGERDVLDLCRGRGRGIVYCGENCYGWQGPWMERSGWQQISDACCGVSHEFGRAMGNDEPVTPVFPNSDYCTGVSGVIGIITALLRRAEEGGSYTVKIALNYYSQWLVNTCGTYPPDVWADLWQRHGSPVFRHHHPMQYLLPRTLALVSQNSGHKLLRPEFFTQYRVKSTGKDMRIVAPVLRYPNGEVKPGFHIGTRTNGVDQPVWPDDLGVEVVVAKSGKANTSL